MNRAADDAASGVIWGGVKPETGARCWFLGLLDVDGDAVGILRREAAMTLRRHHADLAGRVKLR